MDVQEVKDAFGEFSKNEHGVISNIQETFDDTYQQFDSYHQ